MDFTVLHKKRLLLITTTITIMIIINIVIMIIIINIHILGGSCKSLDSSKGRKAATFARKSFWRGVLFEMCWLMVCHRLFDSLILEYWLLIIKSRYPNFNLYCMKCLRVWYGHMCILRVFFRFNLRSIVDPLENFCRKPGECWWLSFRTQAPTKKARFQRRKRGIEWKGDETSRTKKIEQVLHLRHLQSPRESGKLVDGLSRKSPEEWKKAWQWRFDM